MYIAQWIDDENDKTEIIDPSKCRAKQPIKAFINQYNYVSNFDHVSI